MGLSPRDLAKMIEESDQIVLPRYKQWMFQHADDALPPEVAQTILHLLTTKPRYRGKSFSASSASFCERAQVLAFLDAPQGTTDAQLAAIFSDGRYRHLRWQAHLLSAHILSEVEFATSWPKKRARATLDGIGVIPDDHPRSSWRGVEFGWELKGVSTFQFAELTRTGPLDKHLAQIARYMLLTGLLLFSLCYEDKTTQSSYEWVIDASDPKIAALIEQQRQELQRLNGYIDTKQLPVVLPECMKQNGPTFTNCSFGGSKFGACPRTFKWPANDTLKGKR